MSTRATPIYEEDETFYAPFFRILINGKKIEEDVMEVTYTDRIDEIDSFELVINNWDAHTGTFKYEPPGTGYEGIFEPGAKVELSLGYLANVRLMLTGQIVSLEPEYPDGGNPTLRVRGLNVLHKLRGAQHSYTWEDKTDSEIAQELGSKPVAEDKPGLGIEVRVSDEASQENRETFVFMANQYDILFLIQRARRRGYLVYLDTDPEDPSEEFLYFGPSNRLRDVAYELEWGLTLQQFRPTLSTVNQVQQVTVRGWNRRTREVIEGTATIDSGPDVNRDQTAVARAVQGRREIITHLPIYTPQDAERLAEEILRHQLQQMITASGATVGLPDLRAGSKLHIAKLGPRFSGIYFVTSSTHVLGESGYRTTFDARREGPLPDPTRN